MGANILAAVVAVARDDRRGVRGRFVSEREIGRAAQPFTSEPPRRATRGGSTGWWLSDAKVKILERELSPARLDRRDRGARWAPSAAAVLVLGGSFFSSVQFRCCSSSLPLLRSSSTRRAQAARTTKITGCDSAGEQHALILPRRRAATSRHVRVAAPGCGRRAAAAGGVLGARRHDRRGTPGE